MTLAVVNAEWIINCQRCSTDVATGSVLVVVNIAYGENNSFKILDDLAFIQLSMDLYISC